MIEDVYYDYEEDNSINNGPNLKKIVIIGACLIIGIIILLVILSMSKEEKGTYAYVEKQMIKAAKNYVDEYHITSDNEVYFDVKTLNFEVPTTCNQTSGVLFQEGNYRAYLSCSDYESKVIKNSNKIKLYGKEVMVLTYGMTFNDPGYSSYEDVLVSGYVGKEPGVYNLYYVPADNSDVIIRKVIVVNNPSIVNLYPVLGLNGDDVEFVKTNDYYQDLGAIAYDKTDGEITNKIKVNNLPNTSVSGEYNVSYVVTNSLGYASALTRKVMVVDESNEHLTVIVGLNNENLTSDSVNIVVNIFGDNYQYTVLPDGNTTTDKSFVYKVNDNGVYVFKVLDQNNNLLEKEVVVENILNTKPSGSCVAILHNDMTTISVSPDSRIVSFRYHVGNNQNIYSLSDSYTMEAVSSLSNVRVDLRNAVGIENTITCQIVNLKSSSINTSTSPTKPIVGQTDPSIGNNNIRYFTYHDVEYVIANTKNHPQTMVRITRDQNYGIAQRVDKEHCDSACLSFAKYYATYLQYKDLSEMNLYDACNYNKLAKFKTLAHGTKQAAIKTIYDEINRGKVVVLQVTGGTERKSRHFFTIVGYRRDRYYPENISEEDLLGIDAWTGNFAFLSVKDLSKRTMFYNKDGYRVDVFSN